MILEKFKKEISYCTFCAKMCRFSCPVAETLNKEKFIPTNKLSLIYLWQKGEIEFDKNLDELIYHCTTCLNCNTFCKHNIEVPTIILEARKISVEKGFYLKNIKEVKDNFDKFNNPYKEDLDKKIEKIVDLELINKKNNLLIFLGCATLNFYEDTIQDTIKILKKKKIEFKILDKNLCCGMPLLNLGLINDFKKIAKKNFNTLKNYQTIISPCPTCIYTFKKRYSDFGLDFKTNFLHILEFLDPLLFSSDFVSPIKEKVVYHDPCYLGRYLKVYEVPRSILNKICKEKVNEFLWNKEESFCCGAGGGLNFTFPDVSKKIAKKRIEEIEKNDILTTACPNCRKNFENIEKIKVKDVINLLADVI